MKTITLTGMQAVRLVMMLEGAAGNRKALRPLRDLRERIAVSAEVLAELVRPVDGGFVIAEGVSALADSDLQLVREEARKLLELLDAQMLVIRDLVWLEPLAKALEAFAD